MTSRLIQSAIYKPASASPSGTTMSTIVHDTTEALCLCQDHSLYLKPIAKMTVSVALPQLKTPGKSISNWEVMERVKAMVAPEQFSALRISKSTMDFIRFEGEVENKGVVKVLRERLDGKSIKLSGFTDILKVRAVENKVDFPTKYDWDSFFRDAEDMNEAVPGERPDTIHLEGLPCRWFSQKDSPHPDRPNEETLAKVFQSFGKVRNVDIPMLDPYREEMLDKNFNTFSFGGHLNFDAYVQYQEYQGFIKAMDSLRGMKLMLKGEDGKAVACNIKVAFDTSKHLSEVAVKRRQQERLKLQELERQREEQKRREKEEEERRKEEERQQKEQEEEEKEKRREERLRKKEQKQREREERRSLKKAKRQQEEEQRRLQMKIATEERRLLLAQRNLESIRLIAELLARAKALKQQQQEAERAEREELERQELARQQEELSRLAQLEARRRRQEEELRRVEAEKERALELQRKEKELRDKLLGNLLKKGGGGGGGEEDQALHREKDVASDSSGLVGSDVILGLLLAPVVVSRAEGDLLGQPPPVKASVVVRSKVAERKKRVSSSSGARGERRGGGGGEDRKRRDREPYKEERRDGRERGGSRERARERRSSSQERRRRRSRTRSRRRDSHSRRRSRSSHRGGGGSRRRSHSRRHRSSRSTSSSRDRSRSSRGRSYSGGGRSHRSGGGGSSGSSRSTSKSRDRRGHGERRRSRRRSYSRDRRRR